MGCLDPDMSRLWVPDASLRLPLHGSLLRVLAHSGHTGWSIRAIRRRTRRWWLAVEAIAKLWANRWHPHVDADVSNVQATASRRVHAITPRSTPYGQLCRVSFTNPLTSRAIESLLSADTRRRGPVLPISRCRVTSALYLCQPRHAELSLNCLISEVMRPAWVTWSPKPPKCPTPPCSIATRRSSCAGAYSNSPQPAQFRYGTVRARSTPTGRELLVSGLIVKSNPRPRR